MKTFLTSILVLSAAVALCAAVPVPEDSSKTPAVVADAPETPVATTATKQNPFQETLNSINENISTFISNIPTLPPITGLSNVFSAGNTAAATGSEADAAAAPAATNPIESAFNSVATFVQTGWSNLTNALTPTTTQATKAGETTPAAPAVAAADVTEASA